MARNFCGRVCSDRDFQLQHDRPSDFVHSVLFISPLPYAVTVTCVSVHALTMSVYSGFTSAYDVKILIWLTYWSFFTLTARFLLTAFNAWAFVYSQRVKRHSGQPDGTAQKQEEESCEMPALYKVQWVLQNASSCAAFIVTILYWIVMYDPNKPESARSINSHLLNSLFVLADLLLSRAPVRVHHFIHASCFVAVYFLFSIVYWAAGGTNDLGEPFIYSLLDYTGHPGRAAGVALAVDLVGTPFMQGLLYLLFRLRQWAWGRCRQRKDTVPAVDVQVSNLSLGSRSEQRQSGEKDISLDEVSENMHGFRGRNYTLTSSKDEGDVMIDVDMDFEMDEVSFSTSRPTLQKDNSQVSCTASTAVLLT